jgi:integrase
MYTGRDHEGGGDGDGDDDFEEWLIRRNLSQGTIDKYLAHAAACDEAGGWRERLGDGSLAPNTRHLSRAAMRAWAKFSRDHDLLEELEEFKMPPRERVEAKVPLSTEEWTQLIMEVEEANYLDDAVRASLGIICIRGLRVGDVCRLHRRQLRKGAQSGVITFEAKGGRRLSCSVEAFSWCVESLLDSDESWDRVSDLISPRAASEGRHDQATKRLQRRLKRVAAEAGVDETSVYPHRLRRTYAVHFYDACKDPEKLRQHNGWKSIETAMSYVDHTRQEELDAIAIDVHKRRMKK